MILDDAQIEAEMQGIVNDTWPPAARERVLRTGVGKAELDAFFDSMIVLKAQKIADRDVEQAVFDAQQAALTVIPPV